MSCVVMYQPYQASSYMLPGGPPPGPSSTSHIAHQLPSLSAGFDRLPVTTSATAAATSPVNSPPSPVAAHQRLPPTTNNGLHSSLVEPKLEKNLDINQQSCDAYGQALMASRGASEATADQVNSPSTSRPSSAQTQMVERRDSYEAVSSAEANNLDSKSGSRTYLSSNICEVKYYDGDAASKVQEHFNLSLEKSNDKDASTPMNQRQLPSSFWQIPQQNSNGSNNGSTSTSTSIPVTSATSYADFYADAIQQTAALHTALTADWNYPSAHSQSSYNRSSSHPYSNYTRFHQQAAGSYWAAASARLGQVKGEWAGDYQAAAAAAALQGATGLHNAAAGDFTHHYGAAATAHHYANMTGLETAMQDSNKDLYWHASF